MSKTGNPIMSPPCSKRAILIIGAFVIAISTNGLFSSSFSSSVNAQDAKKNPPAKESKQEQAVEWAETFNRRFIKRVPLLGEYAPTASAFDEHGEKFRMSQTEGKYTVIVFGCLT